MACLAVVLAAGACGSDGPGNGAPGSSASSSTGSSSGSSDGLPADAPRRVVSLSPSLTEIVYAIGAGDQVVAVDQYSNHPPQAPTTELSGFRPNVEAIAGYEPDLVLVPRDRDGIVAALGAVGIDALVLSAPAGLEELYDQMRLLGDRLGHARAAADLVASVQRDLADLAASVTTRAEPLRYYYELSDALASTTSDSFIGQVLALAGMRSIADGVDPAAGAFPTLTNEYLLAADPEVVLLAHANPTDGPDALVAAVAARPGWAELDAVRADRVVVLDAELASRWGPRIVDLLRTVVDQVGLR